MTNLKTVFDFMIAKWKNTKGNLKPKYNLEGHS